MGSEQSEQVDVRGPVSLLRWLFYLLRDTYNIWYEERTIRLGAGLAYYGIFAVVPLATLAVALAQVLFSQDEVQQFITEQLQAIFGQQESVDIAVNLTDILSTAESAASLELVGLISLIVAASLVFVALQDALNVIWAQPRVHGIANLIRRYALAYAVVLLLGSLLVAGLVVQSIAGLAEQLIPGQFTVLESLAELVGVLASWALGIGVLAVLFRILPKNTVPWKAAGIGATVTAGAMAIGSWVIGAYLSRYSTSSLAGAAGSVVMALLWIYYIAQILLAGAVLTRTITQRINQPPAPATPEFAADQDKPASTNP